MFRITQNVIASPANLDELRDILIDFAIVFLWLHAFLREVGT